MLSSKYLFHLCLSVTLMIICLFLKMPPVRQSRRLAQQEVDVDDTSYACFLCLIMIDVTMHAAKLTPCCSRRIHRICYQHHMNSHDCCGNCRTPFAATNPVRVPDREQQRQQAIRDLEALLEPGAIEDWITQVGGLGVSSNLQESFVQMSPGMYKYHLTLRT